MRDNPGLPVIDLREPEEFAGEPGQIRGARNAPLADLGRHLEELAFVRALAPVRDSTLLVYCREHDACGEEGVRRLRAAGFHNVLLLDGGIEAWIRAGYGVLGPRPPVTGDATLSRYPPTHWRRLADGRLFEGGRETATGLFVAGRLNGERFVPVGGVEGTGEFCAAWQRRSSRRPRTGWLELRDGRRYPDSSPRDPESPYVHGCFGADGSFHPESREVH
jgi:rhodanese-related sulfurtransferase